ncbi:hypothetical protein CH278_12945 [Rhodococcus sp. 05-2254-5]|nr:hypothetical protein CH278_12945 [Rhodococcus sp. 05-2254-5]OZE51043.1 hypothetical protein CH269_25890 [Rhodococcus sp. 05-2254-1]
MHPTTEGTLVNVKNKIVAVSAVVLAGASIGGGIAAAHTLGHSAASHDSVVDTPEAGDTPDAPGAVDVPEAGDTPDAPGAVDVPEAGDTPDAVDAPEAGDTPDAPGSVDLPEPGDIADAPGQ